MINIDEIRGNLKNVPGGFLKLIRDDGSRMAVNAGVAAATVLAITGGFNVLKSQYNSGWIEGYGTGWDVGEEYSRFPLAENGVTGFVDLDTFMEIETLEDMIQKEDFKDPEKRRELANEIKRNVAHIIGCKLNDFEPNYEGVHLNDEDNLIIKPGSIEYQTLQDDGKTVATTIWEGQNQDDPMYGLTEDYANLSKALDDFSKSTNEDVCKNGAEKAVEHAQNIRTFSKKYLIVPEPSDPTRLTVISYEDIQQCVWDAVEHFQEEQDNAQGALTRYVTAKQEEKAIQVGIKQAELLAEKQKGGIEGVKRVQAKYNEPTIE